MEYIIIVGVIFLLFAIASHKTDKQLSDEASKLPPFTKSQAEFYYRNYLKDKEK